MILANFGLHDGDIVGKVWLQQTDRQLLLQKDPSNNHNSSFLTYPNPNTVLRMNMAKVGILLG